MSSTNKVRVALLFGGKSGEHDVSLLSAKSVMKAIDSQKYEVLPVLISKTGEWQVDETSLQFLQGNNERVEKLANTSVNRQVARSVQPFPSILDSEVDVVFPLLHGPNGEDGTIQGLLQLAGKPYVGAGVLASAAGMDKVIMKRLFAEAGLPQGDFAGYLRSDIDRRMDHIVVEIEERFGYPCFVKPANLGSSVGISKARNREQLIEALELACRYDRKIIVEQFMDAREIELAVLGNDDPIVSIPGEIVSEHEFYDYTAKYTDGKSELIIPAELDEKTVNTLTELAKKAFSTIDGAGLARVDFFVDRNNGQIYLNEINTMPGFTMYSMYPLLWQHSGISYSELIDRLIQLALLRHEDMDRSVSSYEQK